MRIISKFHDYYDSVQAHGFDPKLIYRRETREVLIQSLTFPSSYFESKLREKPFAALWRTHPVFLCFCGKCYPFFMFEGAPHASGEELVDAYRSRVQQCPDVKPYRNSLETLLSVGRRRKVSIFEELTAYLDRIRGDEVDADLFRRVESPVVLVQKIGRWLYEDYSFVVNPRLEEFRFYRWVDPFTAYQEIAMFLGNQLAQPDIAPQSVGGDDVIARAKGFDDKSFRTQAPGNKKLNRKANKARKKRA